MTYYLKKQWKINLLIVILQIAWAATDVLPNLAMIRATQGIVDRDLGQFLYWLLVMLILWAAYLILECIRTWAKSKSTRGMNNLIRADIAASMLKDGHREYHAKQSGEHLSRLTNDVAQVQNLAWDSCFGLVSLTAKVVFSVIALGQMHWGLLAVSGVVSVISLLTPKLTSKRMEALSQEYSTSQGTAMGKMKDMLAGLDVLWSFGRTDRFMEGIREASDHSEKGRHKFTCTKTYISNGVSAISILCEVVINLVIGVLSIKGLIPNTAILGGGNLVGTVTGGFFSISQEIISLKAAKPYFDKITVHADALDLCSDTASAPVEDAITVENLSFSYGDKPVLEQADFRFEKGGKYALTGTSGCGKSTLLKLLLGWLPDYSGTIRFDGRDARDVTPDQLQRQMSYIEQDVFLFNTTIRENITLGGEFTDEQLRKAIHDSALEGDLAAMPLGLDTPVGEDGSSLSGGQKQRVAIARALIHDRSILLVDEGTSALDQKNADIVEKSLLSNPDLTLILVSHHLTGERKKQFTQVFQLETVA